ARGAQPRSTAIGAALAVAGGPAWEHTSRSVTKGRGTGNRMQARRTSGPRAIRLPRGSTLGIPRLGRGGSQAEGVFDGVRRPAGGTPIPEGITGPGDAPVGLGV